MSHESSILHAVAHLVALALVLLTHRCHRQAADPPAILLNDLVLTTCAAALHFHTMGVSNTRQSYRLHDFFLHTINDFLLFFISRF